MLHCENLLLVVLLTVHLEFIVRPVSLIMSLLQRVLVLRRSFNFGFSSFKIYIEVSLITRILNNTLWLCLMLVLVL